jgi:hypothetical protein
MANTWTLLCQDSELDTGNVLAGILNAGARVLKIRRVGMLNVQTAAATTSIAEIHLYWLSATATWAGESATTPISHDTSNSALVSVDAGYAGTPATTGTSYDIRRTCWSSDEAAVSADGTDEWEAFVPLNIMWDQGYGDSDLESLTLRQDQMIYLKSVYCGETNGEIDVWIEFTDEAA